MGHPQNRELDCPNCGREEVPLFPMYDDPDTDGADRYTCHWCGETLIEET